MYIKSIFTLGSACCFVLYHYQRSVYLSILVYSVVNHLVRDRFTANSSRNRKKWRIYSLCIVSICANDSPANSVRYPRDRSWYRFTNLDVMEALVDHTGHTEPRSSCADPLEWTHTRGTATLRLKKLSWPRRQALGYHRLWNVFHLCVCIICIGNLHFTNILSGDESLNESLYCCAVFNAQLRATVQGDDQLIMPRTSPAQGILNYRRAVIGLPDRQRMLFGASSAEEDVIVLCLWRHGSYTEWWPIIWYVGFTIVQMRYAWHTVCTYSLHVNYPNISYLYYGISKNNNQHTHWPRLSYNVRCWGKYFEFIFRLIGSSV